MRPSTPKGCERVLGVRAGEAAASAAAAATASTAVPAASAAAGNGAAEAHNVHGAVAGGSDVCWLSVDQPTHDHFRRILARCGLDELLCKAVGAQEA